MGCGRRVVVARKPDLLLVLVVVALLGLLALTLEYPGPLPSRFPIYAGSRFTLPANTTLTVNFTVGPTNGTATGGWSADGSVCAVFAPAGAYLLRGPPFGPITCAKSATLRQMLNPGTWSLWMRLQEPAPPSSTVTVTTTFEVLYPS